MRQAEFEAGFEGGEVRFRRQITIDQIDLLFGEGFRLLLGKALLRQMFDKSVGVKSNGFGHGRTIDYATGMCNFGSVSSGQLPITWSPVGQMSEASPDTLADTGWRRPPPGCPCPAPDCPSSPKNFVSFRKNTQNWGGKRDGRCDIRPQALFLEEI